MAFNIMLKHQLHPTSDSKFSMRWKLSPNTTDTHNHTWKYCLEQNASHRTRYKLFYPIHDGEEHYDICTNEYTFNGYFPVHLDRRFPIVRILIKDENDISICGVSDKFIMELSSNENEGPVFCICGQTSNDPCMNCNCTGYGKNKTNWIKCDACAHWVHECCVGNPTSEPPVSIISKDVYDNYIPYICPFCQPLPLPSNINSQFNSLAHRMTQMTKMVAEFSNYRRNQNITNVYRTPKLLAEIVCKIANEYLINHCSISKNNINNNGGQQGIRCSIELFAGEGNIARYNIYGTSNIEVDTDTNMNSNSNSNSDSMVNRYIIHAIDNDAKAIAKGKKEFESMSNTMVNDIRFRNIDLCNGDLFTSEFFTCPGSLKIDIIYCNPPFEKAMIAINDCIALAKYHSCDPLFAFILPVDIFDGSRNRAFIYRYMDFHVVEEHKVGTWNYSSSCGGKKMTDDSVWLMKIGREGKYEWKTINHTLARDYW